MVFKKPYAFFIKYFRLINLFLVLLFCFLVYKLNLISDVVADIYSGSITNYSTLNSTYIGFSMYLLIFMIVLIVGSIILLLKRKKKPLNDYLFSLIYIFIILGYLFFISNFFFTLEEVIIEQTTLRLYKDIAFLIILPIYYFVIKFVVIVIGFNLSKFNFTKDILEIKQEEKDNEEVELVFDKNTYKYKRKFRKTLREFKYYVSENKLFISIILGVLGLILIITFFSLSIFNSNKVKINENFMAGGINYKVTNLYQTSYNSIHNIIDDKSKFIIANVSIKNNSVASSIDFKRIRLFYGKEYVYANNYYNKNFSDLGNPYNNEVLKTGESYNYIFIFKVPNSYKSKNYILKFYDRATVKNDEIIGSYKELKTRVKDLDKNCDEKIINLNENVVFNKNKYGNSSLSLFDYEINSTYIYNNGDKTEVIGDKDINNTMLILNYKLILDENSTLLNFISNDSDFFNKFISVSYNYNGQEKIYNNVKVLKNIGEKVMLSIPYEIKDSNNLNVIINFRDVKIVYKLK